MGLPLIGKLLGHSQPATIFRWQPPIPVNWSKKRLLEHLTKYPYPVTLGDVAGSAAALLCYIEMTEPLARFYMTPEELEQVREHAPSVERLYSSKQSELTNIWGQIELASIRKVNAKNAKETLFMASVSNYFFKRYGKWFDAVVAALTQVVFDLRDAVDLERVREARRVREGPGDCDKN
jgi:hypothetical protein